MNLVDNSGKDLFKPVIETRLIFRLIEFSVYII